MLARTVMKNVIYNSSSLLVASISGLIVVIFLARALGPELFGIYSLSISIAYIFLIFADLGISEAAKRYIADAVAKDDYGLAGGYFRFLFRLKLALSLLVSAIVAIFANPLSQVFGKPIAEPLLILSLFLFLFSIKNLFLGVANAMNDFKLNFFESAISGVAKLLFTFLLILLGLSLLGAVLAVTISAIAAMFFVIYYVWGMYPRIFTSKGKVDEFRVLRFITFTALLSSTWVVFANVDVVMIGYFLEAEEVAFYRAAFNIISAISGLIAVPSVLLPVFVKLEGEDLSKAFLRTFKFSSALCIPAAFGTIAIAKNLLLFAYGAEYVPGLSVLQVLSLLLISPSFGIYGAVFSSKEKPELNFYPLVLSMFLNVALNFVLIPILGIEGAAIATVSSNVAFWALLVAIGAKEFSIFPRPEFVAKPIFSSLVMFLVAMNFDSMLLTIPISVLVYSALMFLVRGITKEDIDFLRAIAKVR